MPKVPKGSRDLSRASKGFEKTEKTILFERFFRLISFEFSRQKSALEFTGAILAFWRENSHF